MAVILVFAVRAQFAARKTKGFPYVPCGTLFTPAERSFLRVLERSAGNDFRIMGKVRLADIIAVDERLPDNQKMAARGKINQKHVDFVLCDPQTLAVVLVVELDDRSHERPERRKRDAFVDRALAAAGVPIAHIPVQSSYSIDDIRRRIYENLA